MLEQREPLPAARTLATRGEYLVVEATNVNLQRWTQRPGVILAAIFTISAAARIVVGVLRTTPLYYPDEYIYNELARSIAHTGVPGIRGANWDFPAVLGPYFMAPAWWISNVHVAYHVVLGLGALWFSVAAFPAYLLARRVGVSTGGALLVALFAVLVPDAVFASVAMTEPYAYTLFLVTMLVAVDAIAFPTAKRQVGVLLLMGLLCLARVQFVVVPIAYLLAAVIHARGVRRAARDQSIIIALLAGAAILVLAAGPGRVEGYYGRYLDRSIELSSLWSWFGLNLFVLLIAAGWAVVPSATAGLTALARSADARGRAFAALTLSTTFVLLAEATHFASVAGRPYERYVFYAAPLLVIAAVWAVEQHRVSRGYALIGYVLAALAILLPATELLRSASSGQSPSLLWLHPFDRTGTSVAALAWSAGLAVAAIAVAQLRDRPRAALVIGLAVVSAVTLQATTAFVRFAPLEQRAAKGSVVGAFELSPPSGTALVSWPGTNQFVLMKTLFWSPHIERVLVLGGGKAADGLASTPVFLRRGGGIADQAGRPVPGPYAFPLDAAVAAPGQPAWVARWPAAVIFGVDRADHLLGTAAQLEVSAAPARRLVELQLGAVSPRRVTVLCPARRLDVRFPPGRQSVRLPVPAGRALSCRISLTAGAAVGDDTTVTSGVRILRFAVTSV